MKEDQNEMIRYFSDFLTEINLIITNIKDCVYQIIDVNLIPSKSKIVFQSMSSIILGTHKTYDDLKKIQSILTGFIKSKRISSDSSASSKKRSKTSFSRLNPSTQKIVKNDQNGFCQVAIPNEANQAKTIKRKVISKAQIKQLMQRSANSQEEIVIPNKTQDNMIVKHSIERGMQHSCSQIILAKNIHENSQLKIKNIVKQNGFSLSKIMETNNQCLRIVRSAKKEVKPKKKK